MTVAVEGQSLGPRQHMFMLAEVAMGWMGQSLGPQEKYVDVSRGDKMSPFYFYLLLLYSVAVTNFIVFLILFFTGLKITPSIFIFVEVVINNLLLMSDREVQSHGRGYFIS